MISIPDQIRSLLENTYKDRHELTNMAAFKNEIVLHGVGKSDRTRPDEFLRISIEKEKTKTSLLQLGLQLDFFNADFIRTEALSAIAKTTMSLWASKMKI